MAPTTFRRCMSHYGSPLRVSEDIHVNIRANADDRHRRLQLRDPIHDPIDRPDSVNNRYNPQVPSVVHRSSSLTAPRLATC